MRICKLKFVKLDVNQLVLSWGGKIGTASRDIWAWWDYGVGIRSWNRVGTHLEKVSTKRLCRKNSSKVNYDTISLAKLFSILKFWRGGVFSRDQVFASYLMEHNLETDSRLTSGEWCGFFNESHRSERGWMHLFMTFIDGKIKSEGTDYVGPWHFNGTYDLDANRCDWVKQYLGKHQVNYKGALVDDGIKGNWEIVGFTTGTFHIWPKHLTMIQHKYLEEEIEMPAEMKRSISSSLGSDLI